MGRLLDGERRSGLDHLPYYRDFAARVERLKGRLLALLRGLQADGRVVAAYGASAKGTTLLSYCGIGSDLLSFVVDRSPMKQGRFTPGARLPVFGPERLLASMPDAVLLLAWNFADEIMAQQADYVGRGGRFITPIPEPAFLS